MKRRLIILIVIWVIAYIPGQFIKSKTGTTGYYICFVIFTVLTFIAHSRRNDKEKAEMEEIDNYLKDDDKAN